MDQFLYSASLLSIQLLPILGIAVLIILIIFLIKGIKLITTIIDTMKRGYTTLDLVDKSIEKAQAPLDTAVKLSKTVDDAHDATVKAIKNSAAYLNKNKEIIKDKVNKMVSKGTDNSPKDMSDII